MQHRVALVAALAAAFCLAAPAAAQTTWYVDLQGTAPGSGTSADPYTSIQYAIAQAATVTGDTLEVAAGSYVENIDFLEKGLTVRSASGPTATEIVAAGPGHVVVMNADEFIGGCTLEGFTVRGSTAAQYAGIFIPAQSGVAYGQGYVRRCIVTANAGRGIDIVYTGIITESTLWGNQRSGIETSGHDVAAYVANVIEGGNGEPPFITGHFVFVEYCVLSDLTDVYGGPNTQADPLLWNPANGDFHLMPGSPCIDSGDPSSPTDPNGSRIDVGALTFDPGWAAGPAVYCTSKTNSLGCLPAIGSTGTPSASSSSPFVIDCTQVLNNKDGLLFYGYSAKNDPYQGGRLCVRSPVKRTQVQDSGGNPPPNDCSGVYQFDFNARIQSGADPALVPGQPFFAQYFFRDPGDPTGFFVSRSDALGGVVGL